MTAHYTFYPYTSPSSLFSNNPLDITTTINDAGFCLYVMAVITEGNTARTGGNPVWDVGGVNEELTPCGEGFVAHTECGIEMFYLKDPTPGTNKTLRIPNTGSLNIALFSGVLEPAEGYGAPNLIDTGNATGLTANPSMTSGSLPAECFVYAGLASGYRNTPTAGGSGLYTLQNVYDEGQFVWGIETTNDAGVAGTKTVDFTQNADDWGLLYMAFEPVEASGLAIPVIMNQYRQRKN